MISRDEESRLIGYFIPSAPEVPPSHSAFEKLWRLISIYGVLLTAITVTAFSTAIVYLLTAQRTYRSEAALVAVSDKDSARTLESIGGQIGGLASLIGIDFDVDAEKREAIATLRSKSFLMGFIRDKRLLPVLFADRWNTESGRWELSWWQAVPTVQDAREVMEKRIFRVIDDKTSGLVWIRVDWKDPIVAAEWANELVARANALLQKRAIEDASQSLAFLDKELAKTTVIELRQAIHRLQEAQIRRVMLANVRQEYSFKVIDPAIPADVDDYVRPNVVLTLCLGIVGGLVLGLIVVMFMDSSRTRRQSMGASEAK